jgi:hypothetical protein
MRSSKNQAGLKTNYVHPQGFLGYELWYTSESITTLPPFGPIEGHKRYDQISS